MGNFEKFENQLIDSYESTLSIEGEEICKEIRSIYNNNIYLDTEKARSYCLFYTHPERKDIDKKLFDKCKNYLDNLRNHGNIKSQLKFMQKTRFKE